MRAIKQLACYLASCLSGRCLSFFTILGWATEAILRAFFSIFQLKRPWSALFLEMLCFLAFGRTDGTCFLQLLCHLSLYLCDRYAPPGSASDHTLFCFYYQRYEMTVVLFSASLLIYLQSCSITHHFIMGLFNLDNRKSSHPQNKLTVWVFLLIFLRFFLRRSCWGNRL